MLYPVISLINRSPALLPMDLTLTQKILGAKKLDGRINLHGKGKNVFLIRIGVPFLMITENSIPSKMSTNKIEKKISGQSHNAQCFYVILDQPPIMHNA